jgi:hypothetical protein
MGTMFYLKKLNGNGWQVTPKGANTAYMNTSNSVQKVYANNIFIVIIKAEIITLWNSHPLRAPPSSVEVGRGEIYELGTW